MPSVRPQAKRQRDDGVWVYDARIPIEVTLDHAAVALAVTDGRPDRARVAKDALPKALQELVKLLLAGEPVVPPPSVVRQWRERLIRDGVFPAS
ncbi:hypothetical protein ACFXGA_18780 [Actinosynnema sp. NPDC059335]|uniref:hypothetical protein n=1 Tax=Actinosynnema sp. NPDC059335 TaxID=3346804 RepID=UPI00366C7D56